MSKFKFIAAVGASALMVTGAVSTAASAQPWRDHGPVYDEYRGNLTTSYVDSLEWKINNAAHEGRISWGHARQLRRELRSVQNLAWRVETGQASGYEYRRLAHVVNRIEAAIHSYARYDRGPRYGYNDYRYR